MRPASIILEADPPSHTRTRGVLSRVLSRSKLEKLRAGFDQEAHRLIEELLLRGRFDGVKQLAEAFPFSVFPDAVGLIREGRENLLPYGNMVFNAFGPHSRSASLACALALNLTRELFDLGAAGGEDAFDIRARALALTTFMQE